MLKRIYSSTNLTSMNAPFQTSDSFRSICIRIYGTYSTAAQVVGNVGRIQYFKGDQEYINADYDALISLCHIMGGHPTFYVDGTTDYESFLRIPRHYLDDNVEQVEPSDNARLYCNFNTALATNTTAGLIEVFIEPASGVQKYNLRIMQQAITMTGAGTYPYTIKQANCLMACLSATVSTVYTLVGSNITQINLTKGLSNLSMSLQALQMMTNASFKIELAVGADYYQIAAVLFASHGDISERLHDEFEISLTVSGACVAQVLVLGAEFDVSRFDKTVSMQRNRISTVLAKKAQRGQKQTVESVRKLTGVGV